MQSTITYNELRSHKAPKNKRQSITEMLKLIGSPNQNDPGKHGN